MIGGVPVRTPVWLAPLAGVSTRSFRAWHIKMGAPLVHTEMVSAVGLAMGNEKTRGLLGCGDEGAPIVLQLFAPDARAAARALDVALSRVRYCAIEINMACPMPKVTKRGCGAALIDRPDEAAAIVRTMREPSLPVWVKTRLPDTRSHRSADGFCREMIDAGADLIMLHGRTPRQRYEGTADAGAVISAARHFPGMICASGDVYAPEDARRYLDGGCAAVLAARGAVRDAYIFPRIHRSLGHDVPDRYVMPDLKERAHDLREAGRVAAEHEGARHGFVMAKRMLAGFLRDLPGSSSIRKKIAAMREWKEADDLLTELIECPSDDIDESTEA